jgi:hypothetical protein
MDDDMSYLVGKHWTKPPEGRVWRWIPDGQEGGCMIAFTPEEAAHHDAMLASEESGD